ncbi:hypothetical protein DFJ73DRAFT_795401 [Zopfochytrium polystomum]|nr:hypothetical protein DFJ73DRAFT_795401 [Zopfochytrium polystomum]
MKRARPIHNVPAASAVELKAELFKSTADFDRARKSLPQQLVPVSTKTFKKHKAGGKTPLPDPDEPHADDPEMLKLEASWVSLQRKTKLYDQIKRSAEKGGEGSEILYGGSDEVLAEFVKKRTSKAEGEAREDDSDSDASNDEKKDEESADPWVETTDQFGRTRIVRRSQQAQLAAPKLSSFVKGGSGVGNSSDDHDGPGLVSADMRREAERLRWEAEAQASIQDPLPPPKHFDHRREIRTMGVGFYAFSQDEERRRREMEALESMRKSTVDSRVRAAQAKEERKNRLEERKAMLRDRRQRKLKNAEGGADGDGVGDTHFDAGGDDGAGGTEGLNEFLRSVREELE